METVVNRLMARVQPEGFVCANDRTAGDLMHTILKLGYEIPREVKIVGIDDVSYAKLLPVPLTTIRQPCREIGASAMATMRARIERSNMLAREISLDGKLIVRESSGFRTAESQ